jgi:hypothetical protein
VPIAVNTAKGIAGGDLVLTYDAGAFTAKEAKSSELLTGAGITLIPNLGTAGKVQIAMAGAAGIVSGSGTLLTVNFEINAGTAPGAYELALQAMLWDENGMALPATVKHGAITVKAASGKPAAGTPGLDDLRFVSALQPSYPNPFNSAALVPYQVADPVHVRLAVYNMLGQEVRFLVDQVQGSGSYQVVWDGRDEQGREATSGAYLCRLRAGDVEAVRRMALVR